MPTPKHLVAAPWDGREQGQIFFFLLFTVFLKVVNNDLGSFGTHFADEKTEAQEK